MRHLLIDPSQLGKGLEHIADLVIKLEAELDTLRDQLDDAHEEVEILSAKHKEAMERIDALISELQKEAS